MPLHISSHTQPILAALIDLDGTLVDTLGDFEAALRSALAELNLAAPSSQAIAHMVGKGTDHLLESVLAHSQKLPTSQTPDAATFAELRTRYLRHYRAINGQHSRVYPGVVEGLQALRTAGLALICLTNKPQALAEPLLAAKGLNGFFAHVFGGDYFPRKKPDPLPLLEACRVLNLPTAAVLMVGDSSNDAQAAHAAGCPVALLRYGYNHGRPIEEVPAQMYLESLADLRAGL